MKYLVSLLSPLAGGLFLALASCSSAPRVAGPQPLADTPQALAALVANTSTPDASRQAADRKLTQLTSATSPQRLAILEQIVWAPGNSDAMRIYALDQIATADPARAGHVLMLYLPQITAPPVLAHACELAATLGDLRVTGALVRSLAEPRPDLGNLPLPDRPEAHALTKLMSMPLDSILWNQLTTDRDTSVRTAALDTLRRWKGVGPVRARLLAIPATDDFLRGLQAYTRTFTALPAGAQEIAWAIALENPEHTLLREAAERRLPTLPEAAAGQPWPPRFIHVLARAPRKLFVLDRAALRQWLVDRKIPMSAHAAEQLSRGDLLTLAVLSRGLDSPDLCQQVLNFGMADMTDTTSAHGGLLSISSRPSEPAALALTLYPPLYTGDDRRYVPGNQLHTDRLDALVAFSLHFQQVFNSAHIGPDAAELSAARTHHVNGVVFTSIGTGRFNATYYTPAGVIVDLGSFPRNR